MLSRLSNAAKRNPQWVQCRDEVHCIQLLSKESDPPEHAITTRTTADYMVNRDSHGTLLLLLQYIPFITKICRHLTQYFLCLFSDTGTIKLLEIASIYRFSTGWLYNSAVESDYRRRLDSEMISLRISGMVNDILGAFQFSAGSIAED